MCKHSRSKWKYLASTFHYDSGNATKKELDKIIERINE